MEKSVRLKICTGDKRHFGDDITNLGPLIPLKTPEARNAAPMSKRPLTNSSSSPISDENEEPVKKKAKKCKKFFAHEKAKLVQVMKNLRQFLNNRWGLTYIFNSSIS